MCAAQNGHEEVRAVVVCEVVRRVLRLQYSSIHVLSSHHLEQVARELLVAKANVNHQSNDGRTALMQAAQNGHEEVCSSCTFSVSIVVSKSRAHISTSALHTISIRSPSNC